MTDHFLFFTDLHFWEVVWNPLRLANKRLLGNANVLLRRRHHFPMANAEPIARHALATGARGVVIGGDLTSTATSGEFRMAAEFARFLQREGVRIQVVPGNHDVYTFEAKRSRRFERHFGAWIPPEGYPARRDLPGGTPVILVSSVCPNWVSSKGHIAPSAIEAIEALVEGTPEGPVLVVGHYPLLDETTEYSLRPGRRLEGAQRLRAALGRSGRQVLHMAGHVHRFSSCPDPDYPNVHHVTGPALFNHWAPAGRNGGFLEIECHSDGFRVHHRFKTDDEWMVETVEPDGSRRPVSAYSE